MKRKSFAPALLAFALCLSAGCGRTSSADGRALEGAWTVYDMGSGPGVGYLFSKDGARTNARISDFDSASTGPDAYRIRVTASQGKPRAASEPVSEFVFKATNGLIQGTYSAAALPDRPSPTCAAYTTPVWGKVLEPGKLLELHFTARQFPTAATCVPYEMTLKLGRIP